MNMTPVYDRVYKTYMSTYLKSASSPCEKVYDGTVAATYSSLAALFQ
jgi:hypothetical protein